MPFTWKKFPSIPYPNNSARTRYGLMSGRVEFTHRVIIIIFSELGFRHNLQFSFLTSSLTLDSSSRAAAAAATAHRFHRRHRNRLFLHVSYFSFSIFISMYSIVKGLWWVYESLEKEIWWVIYSCSGCCCV